jgi:LysM repeat protein
VLKLGQTLVVPGGSGSPVVTVPTAGQGKTYVVQRGDTLLSIARRFGLTVKQLQAANNISNPDRIYPGQTLTIP